MFVVKNYLIPEGAPLSLLTFRFEANSSCLFSAFLIAMCGDKRYRNELRILTAIEIYVNPWLYSQHPIFIFAAE